MPTPDYSTLKKTGDHGHDHFSMAVQAAANLLGVNVDYNTVCALSTNCFAPAVAPEESCKAWWMSCYGRDVCLPFVADTLGLSVRDMNAEPRVQETPPEGLKGAEAQEWTEQHWTPAWAEQIRRAHADGEVIILWREWVTDTPHGFNCWAWWGVITGLDTDGRAIGASLNGHADNPIHPWKCGIYALSRTSELSTGDCFDEVLERAVARIEGNSPPFTTYDPYHNYHADIVFGVPSVRVWADAMRQVPFCSSCGERSAADARSSALTVSGGAVEASAFLRKAAAGTESGPDLLKAAECYDRISDILAPYTKNATGSRYEAIIGDAAAQKQHADEIDAVGDCLSTAAGHLAEWRGAAS